MNPLPSASAHDRHHDRRYGACLSCGSRSLRTLDKYAHAHLVRCPACGLTFAGLRPSDEELASCYEGYGTAWYDSPVTRQRYGELLEEFEPYRKTNRILDFGCGAGFFLEEAAGRGWDAYGIEFGALALEINRGKQLKVVPAPLGPETFPPDFFDVVTAFEVVEHLRDPAAEADLIARVLRPAGLFYCTTPNFNAASRRLLASRWSNIVYPEHLCYFTSATLRRWLGRVGFVPVASATTGFSLTVLHRSVSGPDSGAPTGQTGDERLRVAVERSHLLRVGKQVANRFLSTVGAGDTLKASFELPSESTYANHANATRR